jgi:hypothetical protein
LGQTNQWLDVDIRITPELWRLHELLDVQPTEVA